MLVTHQVVSDTGDYTSSLFITLLSCILFAPPTSSPASLSGFQSPPAPTGRGMLLPLPVMAEQHTLTDSHTT